jgi:hypothetical protein
VIHLPLYSVVNSDQQLARPNTQIKFPRDIENSLSERERKKIRRVRGEAPSHRVTPTGTVVTTDQVPSEREPARPMPFLPDPPSFDLTLNRNQWHGLLHEQGAISEKPYGASSLNLLSSACDLVPYL